MRHFFRHLVIAVLLPANVYFRVGETEVGIYVKRCQCVGY